jgi:hypothetical protein
MTHENTDRATIALRVLTAHAVKTSYLEPGTDDTIIVICRCDLRFDAGESHAMHQTGQLDAVQLFAREVPA